MNDPERLPLMRASIEAILLVADEPVAEVVLAQVLECPRDEVDAALRELAAEYAARGRGFDLREVAGGWRFYTRSECAPLVERFLAEEAGTESETGAILYRTTSYFLERLGLPSLEKLPELAPFLPDNVEEIEREQTGS